MAVVVAVNERGGAVALAYGPQAQGATAGHVRRSDRGKEIQSRTDSQQWQAITFSVLRLAVDLSMQRVNQTLAHPIYHLTLYPYALHSFSVFIPSGH